MQLRKSITAPTRLEDEEPNILNNNKGTKPTHPDLMKAKAVPFNPENPPAAFPSLPLTSQATTVTDENMPRQSVTDDSETMNSPLAQNSLAGNSSANEGLQQPQDQTILMDEEDTNENQQDETALCFTSELLGAPLSLTAQRAKSSITATQVIKAYPQETID